MKLRFLPFIYFFATCLLLNGCSTTYSDLRSGDFKEAFSNCLACKTPESDDDIKSMNLISRDDVAIYRKYFGYEASAKPNVGVFSVDFKNQYESASGLAAKKDLRNEMIDELLILADIKYSRYRSDLVTRRKIIDFSSDYYSSLFSGTAALTTGGMTPQILSGISAFVSGTRDSLEKRVYASQTADALTSIMDKRRAMCRKMIEEKRNKRDVDIYSPLAAVSDIMLMQEQSKMEVTISTFADTVQKIANGGVVESPCTSY